jgi:hypothetical protein
MNTVNINMKIKTTPYTEKEIKDMIKAGHVYIKENILIELNDLINNDFEQFLDIVSMKVTGTELLSEIGYNIFGLMDKHTLIMEVTGNISECVDTEE